MNQKNVQITGSIESENTSDSYSYLADLDDTDGLERICIVPSADNSYYHVYVEISEQEEIWSQDFGTVHTGQNAVFLCILDDKEYLLEYSPWVGQGMASYRYCLFDFCDGVRNVVKQKEVQFKLYTQDHVDEQITFMNEVNALLEQSQVIMSTLGGQTVVGFESAEEFKLNPEQLYNYDADK